MTINLQAPDDDNVILVKKLDTEKYAAKLEKKKFPLPITAIYIALLKLLDL